MTDTASTFDGGCTCRVVRYRMTSAPLFVHCCHCRWCQRETGASFALNAMIESERVVLLAGEPEIINTPSNSGKGQKIARCPVCRIAVWSNYGGGGDLVRFVRVGTLDEPDRLPPDIHIFTASKQPWVRGHAGERGVLPARALLAAGEPRPDAGAADPARSRLAWPTSEVPVERHARLGTKRNGPDRPARSFPAPIRVWD